MHDEGTLREAFKRIINEHENNKEDPIPSSEEVYRKIFTDLFAGSAECLDGLDRLVQANYLCKIMLSEADERYDQPEVSGYVAAELPHLKVLKEFYRDKLQAVYESEKYQRKDPATIIKEVVPQMGLYRSTPIGKLVNISVMLEQFEHLIVSNFWDYKETRRRSVLLEVLKKPARKPGQKDEPAGEEGAGDEEVSVFTGDQAEPPILDAPGGVADDFASAPPPDLGPAPVRPSSSPPPAPSSDQEHRRAVDTPDYVQLQEMDLSGKWGTAVAHYGVQFLLRIHFRKYEFDLVARMVNKKRIAKMEDLRYIHETLEKMKGNMKRDSKLRDFTTQMDNLQELAYNRLMLIENARGE